LFLEFRKKSAKDINDYVCEKFMTDGIIDQKTIHKMFGDDPEVVKRIIFVLEGFAKPKNADKARRKDGSHIATHSLQLFRAAKDFYQINDPRVGRAVLVHDLVEDTMITPQNIIDALGEDDADLANFMTEDELDEESKAVEGNDSSKLSVARFVHKLKQGGDAIVVAEILDRMDDVSDLLYITKKLIEPKTKDEAVKSIEEKFAKCIFTVDSLVDENSSEEVLKMKESFHQLVDLQKQKIEKEFDVAISQDVIEEIKSKYRAYYQKDPLEKSYDGKTTL